jgi:pyruvate/2-oxoglutarate dehydrogenase complex dihydrolipoamide acyltransferase (E2) component
MKVTITEKCQRCKREAPREVDSSELPTIEDANKKRKDTVDHIGTLFGELESEAGAAMPDLVVYLRGEVMTLSQVCDAFCLKTVTNARDTMFKDISARKGRPKKANGTAAAEEKKAAAAAKTPPSAVQGKKTPTSSPAK